MAGLTVATATTPPDSQRLGQGIKTVLVSGTSTDATAVVAAVADSQIVITGGWVYYDGGAAETLAILSATTSLLTLTLPAAAGCVQLPPGLIYTADSEALNFNKSGAVASISAIIEYAVIAAGASLYIK